ncbi:WD40/YVTN repeat-like-containing domain superfamily [Sesbania bispinosa]|nr:WD40/YVTN repeat-like-containing domain superfamily [Sesbania bispinosa]
MYAEVFLKCPFMFPQLLMVTIFGYDDNAYISLHVKTIFRNPKVVKPYSVPSPEQCNLPAAAIHASSDMIVVVDYNAPAAHVAQHKWQPNTPDGQGTPFLFQHGKATSGTAGGTLMRMFKGPAGTGEEWQFPQALAFGVSGIRSQAIVAITCDKEIITGGHADNSIRVISSDGAKTLETAYAHRAPVTSLGLSLDSNYLVTGSRDTTVLLWRIHRALASRSSVKSESSVGTGTLPSPSSSSSSYLSIEKNRRRRIEGPIQVLRGHRSEILSCCVSSDLGIVVSCSHTSDVLLHSIKKGRLIRRLDGVVAHSVCLSSEGVVMTWNELQHTLSTFTLNGVLIAKTELSFSSSISCMEISFDGRNALIGINSLENGRSYNSGWNLQSSKSGIVDFNSESEETHEISTINAPTPSICFLDLHTLEVFHVLRLGEGQDITALALNKDNTNLLVSTSDKQLIIFTDPALSLKVVDQMLKLGWEGDGLRPLIKA